MEEGDTPRLTCNYRTARYDWQLSYSIGALLNKATAFLCPIPPPISPMISCLPNVISMQLLTFPDSKVTCLQSIG